MPRAHSRVPPCGLDLPASPVQDAGVAHDGELTQESCIAGGAEGWASLPLPWPHEVAEFPSHGWWSPGREGPALPGYGGQTRAGSSSPLRSGLELPWEY